MLLKRSVLISRLFPVSCLYDLGDNGLTILDTTKSRSEATKDNNEWRYTIHKTYTFLYEALRRPIRRACDLRYDASNRRLETA